MAIAETFETTENSQIDDGRNNSDLGTLKGSFRVRIDGGYFLPLAILGAVALLGFAIFAGAEPGWKTYVSAAFFALTIIPLLFVTWRILPNLCDELRIYDNGFSYVRRSLKFDCRWDEIDAVNEVLDTGNRLKTMSVTKKSGEKIEFAYKMRGLDMLSAEYAAFEYDQLPESEKADSDEVVTTKTLGKQTATFGVRKGLSKYVPILAVLFVTVFGVGTFAVSRDVLVLFVCAVPPTLLLTGLVWNFYNSRKDVLCIFENGFSYKSKEGTFECLWDEIEDYSTVRGGDVTSVKS